MQRQTALFLFLCIAWLSGCQDSPYLGDLVSSPTERGYNFNYEPWMIPVVGKTTEEDVMRYYALGPDKRRTFPCGFSTTIAGQPIQFDREIQYGDSRYSVRNDERMQEYRLREQIVMKVVFNAGVVVGFEICHWIRLPDGSEQPGKQSVNCRGDRKTVVAESRRRLGEYERQRQHYQGTCPVVGQLMAPSHAPQR